MAKFFRRGITKVYALPSVANLAAPTTAEVAAGDDVTAGLASIVGFTSANAPIDTPDADSRFTTNIPGENRPEASGLNYYEDQVTDTMRDLFVEDTEMVIVIFPKGKIATRRCECWPVRVSAANGVIDFGNVAAMEGFQFAITGEPEKDAVTPAA